jgi:hypothetical protein
MYATSRVGRAALTTVMPAVMLGGAAGALAVPAASATTVPGCVASGLHVVRGGTDAATSHRYVKFRITNTSDHTCRLYGTPTFRFRNGSGTPIGYRSEPSGQPAHVVRLQPGQHTRVTVGYVVPDVVPPADCHPRTAASVDMRLAYRTHVYHRAFAASVCTTEQYRPVAYPVGF